MPTRQPCVRSPSSAAMLARYETPATSRRLTIASALVTSCIAGAASAAATAGGSAFAITRRSPAASGAGAGGGRAGPLAAQSRAVRPHAPHEQHVVAAGRARDRHLAGARRVEAEVAGVVRGLVLLIGAEGRAVGEGHVGHVRVAAD